MIDVLLALLGFAAFYGAVWIGFVCLLATLPQDDAEEIQRGIDETVVDDTQTDYWGWP